MKILAFLQNQWFKDPDKVRAILERNPQHRAQFLRRALFAGCLTGKRLKAAFRERCDSIYWEECSPQIGGHSASVFPPDLEHMRRVIGEQQPELIIAFGRVAADALIDVWDGPQLHFPHPAARTVKTADLEQWRGQIERLLEASE